MRKKKRVTHGGQSFEHGGRFPVLSFVGTHADPQLRSTAACAISETKANNNPKVLEISGERDNKTVRRKKYSISAMVCHKMKML